MNSSAPQLPAHSENPDEELIRVKQALESVFSNPVAPVVADGTNELSRRDLADKYLVTFQRLPVAWMVCDRLLMENSGPNSQSQHFFAAQTLHYKCREEVYVAQLPPDSLPSLRDSLMNHLTRFGSGDNSGNTPLITRLCMAIAALSIQMGWKNIIRDVLDKVITARPDLSPVMVELIQLLPEEASSDRLFLVDEDARSEFRECLCRESETVLQFLLQIAQTSNAHQISVLRCLHSWIRHVSMSPTLLQTTPLIDATFQAITTYATTSGGDDTLFESSVDVVVELLQQYSSDPKHNAGLVQKIIPIVMNLGQTPFQTAMKDSDEDVLRGFCRIFTEMGESYMSLITSSAEDNTNLVELILQCSSISDSEIANITLHFWYRFVYALENLEPYQFRQHKVDFYTPILTRLVIVCTTLMKYPSDVEDYQQDMLEDLNQARFYLSETVEDCCRLVSADIVLQNLGQHIQTLYNAFSSLPPNQQLSSWHGIEACLFALKAISQYIPNDENVILPYIMELLTRLPTNIPRLRHTVNLFIGRYAGWLGANPNFLQTLMPYLSEGLSVPQCASASAVAIRQLCHACIHQPALGDAVFQLYESLLTINSNTLIGLRDELQVLEGTCVAVSRQMRNMDANTAQTCVNRIVQPILTRLATIMTPGNSNSSSCKQAIAEIERLTVIVQHLVPLAPSELKYDADGLEQDCRFTLIVPLMSESWPLLEAVASTNFSNDLNIAEKLCRLHKHALRISGAEHYKEPLLDKLMGHLVRNFQQSFHSPYLYAASICITDFSQYTEVKPRLCQMVLEQSTHFFSRLNTLEHFTSHPDVVEEFFYLLGRCMSYCPEALLLSNNNNPLLYPSLKSASLGLHVQHRDVNKGTLNFLEQVVNFGLSLTDDGPDSTVEDYVTCKQALENGIMTEGQPVVANLARSIQGELPLYSLDRGSGSVTGIIVKLNDLCSEMLRKWLDGALAHTPQQIKMDLLAALSHRAARDNLASILMNINSVCVRNRKLAEGVS